MRKIKIIFEECGPIRPQDTDKGRVSLRFVLELMDSDDIQLSPGKGKQFDGM